jgi:hypothetical protein
MRDDDLSVFAQVHIGFENVSAGRDGGAKSAQCVFRMRLSETPMSDNAWGRAL